jgi:hypothetical protein
LHNYSENIYFGYKTDKKSKVKIRKYFKIKVPKNATFDLNVRHGKVTIPESNKKMSANMSYGNFIGGVISGSSNELRFSNSPVEIGILNSSNITLKNVPNAKFGTFENTNLFSNSSDVFIEKIGNNVSLSQKFGNLEMKQGYRLVLLWMQGLIFICFIQMRIKRMYMNLLFLNFFHIQ